MKIILPSLLTLVSLFSTPVFATQFSCNTDSHTRVDIDEAMADDEKMVKLDLTNADGSVAGAFLAHRLPRGKLQIHTLYLCGASLSYFYVNDLNPQSFVADATEFKSVSSYEHATIYQDEALVSLDFLTEDTEDAANHHLVGHIRVFNLADGNETDTGTFRMLVPAAAPRAR